MMSTVRALPPCGNTYGKYSRLKNISSMPIALTLISSVVVVVLQRLVVKTQSSMVGTWSTNTPCLKAQG